MISIIVAVSKNNVIGNKGEIPWRLPADLKHFSSITNSHPIIMGRKTWESLPSKFRPLPGRTNILITRKEDYSAPGAEVTTSLEEALEKAKKATGNEEIFIIGGAEIYKMGFSSSNRVYITRVDTEVNGDAYFPEIKDTEWKLIHEEPHIKDEKNQFNYTFLTYDRRS